MLIMEKEIKSLKEKMHEHKSNKISNIIDESYGSYKGQFKTCEKIANKIVSLIENGEYEKEGNCNIIKVSEKIDNIGNVLFQVNWFEKKYGDTIVRGKREYINDKQVIYLTVYACNIVEYNLVSTIAHEIMHCFQSNLGNINGVNVKSKLLYSKLLFL